MRLRISLYVLAALLLGAHFLRAGNYAMVAICLAVPLLFAWRVHWALIALQLAAYCAAATWVAVAFDLVQTREKYGQRWTAAAIILGSVALYTLIAGLLLNSRSIKQHFPGNESGKSGSE